MSETLLALIPLPMDSEQVVKLLRAITRVYPTAMLRDAEHNGWYMPRGGFDRDERNVVEVILP